MDSGLKGRVMDFDVHDFIVQSRKQGLPSGFPAVGSKGLALHFCSSVSALNPTAVQRPTTMETLIEDRDWQRWRSKWEGLGGLAHTLGGVEASMGVS